MAALTGSVSASGIDWSLFVMPDFDFMSLDNLNAQAVREHLGQAYEVFITKNKGKKPMYVTNYCVATQYKRKQGRENNDISLSSFAYENDGGLAEDRLLLHENTDAEPACAISDMFIDNEYYRECLQDFPNTRDYIAREYTVDLCDLMLSCNKGNTQAMEALREICEQVDGLREAVSNIMHHVGWVADINKMSATMPILLDNEVIPAVLSKALAEIRDMRGYVMAENSMDIVLLAAKTLDGDARAKQKLMTVCKEYTGLQELFKTAFDSELGRNAVQEMQYEDICLE